MLRLTSPQAPPPCVDRHTAVEYSACRSHDTGRLRPQGCRRRVRSARCRSAVAPAWCSFSTPIICSCVNLDRLIVRLLLTDPDFKPGTFQRAGSPARPVVSDTLDERKKLLVTRLALVKSRVAALTNPAKVAGSNIQEPVRSRDLLEGNGDPSETFDNPAGRVGLLHVTVSRRRRSCRAQYASSAADARAPRHKGVRPPA